MTRGDLGIVGVVLAFVIASVLVAAMPAASAPGALIVSPSGRTVVPLDVDATYRVQGSVGEVVVAVEDGSVRCVESSCVDHICVKSGCLAPGRPIVCAPNGVVVSIQSAEEGGLDAISR